MHVDTLPDNLPMVLNSSYASVDIDHLESFFFCNTQRFNFPNDVFEEMISFTKSSVPFKSVISLEKILLGRTLTGTNILFQNFHGYCWISNKFSRLAHEGSELLLICLV